MTSINNYLEFAVKQRKIVAGSNSSRGGTLWRVFFPGHLPPQPYRSRRLYRCGFSI